MDAWILIFNGTIHSHPYFFLMVNLSTLASKTPLRLVPASFPCSYDSPSTAFLPAPTSEHFSRSPGAFQRRMSFRNQEPGYLGGAATGCHCFQNLSVDRARTYTGPTLKSNLASPLTGQSDLRCLQTWCKRRTCHPLRSLLTKNASNITGEKQMDKPGFLRLLLKQKFEGWISERWICLSLPLPFPIPLPCNVHNWESCSRF